MPATLTRPTSLRRPRFRRVETPPPFQLTARDLAILHAVARFRFLSSTLIIRLVGGSSQQILRRLQLLFHHGYLDRPTSQVAQLAHAFDFGNRPFIYGLGRAGAHVLAEAGIPLKEKLDWTTKNARATAQFLAHTIETAETMIAFELACRAEGAPTLIDHHDLLPYLPEETRDDDAPFHARVTLKTSRETEKTGVDAVLSPTALTSLPGEGGPEGRIKALQDKLDAPNKRYQAYQETLKTWQEQKDAIIGSDDKADTVKYYEAQIKYVNEELPKEIAAIKGHRCEVARKVHACIAAIKDIYAELFAPVQQLIEESVIIKEGFKLTFDSSIIERTFQRGFFSPTSIRALPGPFAARRKEPLC